MPNHNEQDLVHRDEALSMFKQRFPSLHDRDTSMSELCETQGHVLQLLEHENYHEAYKKHPSQVQNRLEEWMEILAKARSQWETYFGRSADIPALLSPVIPPNSQFPPAGWEFLHPTQYIIAPSLLHLYRSRSHQPPPKRETSLTLLPPPKRQRVMISDDDDEVPSKEVGERAHGPQRDNPTSSSALPSRGVRRPSPFRSPRLLWPIGWLGRIRVVPHATTRLRLSLHVVPIPTTSVALHRPMWPRPVGGPGASGIGR